MTPVIAFMLANYAARPLGYRRDSWTQAEQATSAYFQPIRTFAGRFEAYLADVRELGFVALEMWQPVLDFRWLTDDHLAAAVDLLDEYGLEVVSFAGFLGSTPDEFEQNCAIAAELNAPLLVGVTSADRDFVAEALRKFGLKWAYENEPEPTPQAILDHLGSADVDVTGICVDVGALAAQGMDAAAALRVLAPRTVHVHLKDMLAGGANVTCRFGSGIVPLERCVRVLQEVGYSGVISIEHETAQYDPSEDVRASLEMLKGWLDAW